MRSGSVECCMHVRRLWRVVSSPRLAHSPLVLQFLELSEAARVVPHAAAASPPQPPQQGPRRQLSQPEDAPGLASNGPEQQQEAQPGAHQESAHIIAAAAAEAHGGSERQMRLGFRIEQRVLLRKHIRLLRQHLDKAAAELKACT